MVTIQYKDIDHLEHASEPHSLSYQIQMGRVIHISQIITFSLQLIDSLQCSHFW